MVLDTYKIILVGSSSTGKTAITMKYTDKFIGKDKLSVPMTIGVEFNCKQIEIDGKQINLQIWDTAGQERFRCIGSSYFRGSDGVMIVFDVNNRSTFNEIDYFFGEANKYALDCSFLLVGAKIDAPSDQRQISFREGVEKAHALGCNYIETSAFDDKNIDEAFFALASACYTKEKQPKQLLEINFNDKSAKKGFFKRFC